MSDAPLNIDLRGVAALGGAVGCRGRRQAPDERGSPAAYEEGNGRGANDACNRPRHEARAWSVRVGGRR